MKNPIPNTIRSRLLLAMVVCGMVPVAILALTSRTIIARAIEQSAYEKYAEISEEIARQVTFIMDRAATDLRLLQSNRKILVPGVNIADRDAEMDRLVRVYEIFDDISLYDERGDLVTSTTIDRPEAVDRTRWFEDALRGKVRISSPQSKVGVAGRLFLSVYLPAENRSPSGEIHRYVLKARLPFDAVWELLDGVTIGGSGFAVLLDEYGNVLSSLEKDRIYTRFDPGVAVSHWWEHPQGIYEDASGQRFVYVATPLEPWETQVGQKWTLLVLTPESAVTAVIGRSNLYHVLAGGCTLLVAVTMGIFLSRRIAQPTIDAASVARKVAAGNLWVTIAPSGPSEIRNLATAFNQMVAELAAHRKDLEDKVTERTRNLRESQAELERLSAQLEAAFESTKEAVLLVRRDGVIIAANGHVEGFFQVPVRQLKGRAFEVVSERFFGCFEDGAAMVAMWREAMGRPSGSLETEFALVRPRRMVVKCYTAPVRNRAGDPFAQLWMFADVTRERELQRGLEQAQKMEAIGRLAGGVAHDFNNLLTGIIGNLSLAEMEGAGAPAFGTVGRHIETAKTAAGRAAELVRQLLGFSRQSHLTLERCEVNGVIDEVHSLLEHTMDPRIEIRLELAEDVGPIRADGTQVQQVLMNLCVNARDAIDGAGGVIRLRSANVEVSAQDAERHGVEGGSFVRVDVEDSGKGMSPGVLSKIFEPFFTTKEPGKGTGLGLATSYGIVKQHGGWIDCSSVPGQGTRFSVFFPRKGVEKVVPVAERPGESAGPDPGGNETVLLVDDDLVVRAVAENVLRRHGYRVVCASDGVEGVERVREQAAELDLVLLDLTMPRLSGRESFRMMREVRADLPVVICSGYVVDVDAFAEETGHRPDGVVQKPYDVCALVRTLRAILDARGRRRAGVVSGGAAAQTS